GERPEQDGRPALVDQDRPVADRRHHAALLVDGDKAELLDRLYALAQAIDGLVLAVGTESRLVHRLDGGIVARPLAKQAQTSGIAQAGGPSQGRGPPSARAIRAD